MTSKFRLPVLRSSYDDHVPMSDATGLDCSCDGVGRAVQSARDECDINTIIRRFGLGGKLPLAGHAPTYGDFTEVKDFQSAMDAVVQARTDFMAMPGHVRAEFDNDPQKFVEMCSDPLNFEKLEKLGLVLPEASKRKRDELAAAKAAETAEAVEKALKARSGKPGRGPEDLGGQA